MTGRTVRTLLLAAVAEAQQAVAAEEMDPRKVMQVAIAHAAGLTGAHDAHIVVRQSEELVILGAKVVVEALGRGSLKVER